MPEEDNVSEALMTFDIEVASNNNNIRVDTGRVFSDIGNLDSRRSMSEILNEGELVFTGKDNLNIQGKVQQRQHKFKSTKIDTVLEDDKENAAYSSTAHGETNKATSSQTSS